jgi:hypothetical protein
MQQPAEDVLKRLRPAVICDQDDQVARADVERG